MDFSLAGIVHEIHAQAPFAPERQREQRRQKRARKGGEKKVEGKIHARSAAFGGQFQINIVLVVHHFFDGEIFVYKLPAAFAEFFPQGWIVRKLQQFLRGGFDVAGANQKSGFIFQTNFVRAVEIVGDDRFAGGERLRQRARQRLAIRQMREAIHDADVTRDFAGRNEAGENDFAVEAERADLIFNFAAQRAVADEQQSRVRNLRQNFGKRGEQIGVAFEFEEAADFADDEMIFFKSEFFAQRQIIRRVEKWFQIETAENAREHCRFSDSGGEIKSGHRVGGAEKMVGDFGGATLGGGENKIGERALKISERRAVDVMDDDRNARAFRGEASENSRLAAVRVDDVGFLRAENFFQFSQREKIEVTGSWFSRLAECPEIKGFIFICGFLGRAVV